MDSECHFCSRGVTASQPWSKSPEFFRCFFVKSTGPCRFFHLNNLFGFSHGFSLSFFSNPGVARRVGSRKSRARSLSYWCAWTNWAPEVWETQGPLGLVSFGEFSPLKLTAIAPENGGPLEFRRFLVETIIFRGFGS